MANNTIITIGRQYGSGGHDIGKQLAEELNVPFYDKALLERAAKDSGLCQMGRRGRIRSVSEYSDAGYRRHDSYDS